MPCARCHTNVQLNNNSSSQLRNCMRANMGREQADKPRKPSQHIPGGNKLADVFWDNPDGQLNCLQQLSATTNTNKTTGPVPSGCESWSGNDVMVDKKPLHGTNKLASAFSLECCCCGSPSLPTC